MTAKFVFWAQALDNASPDHIDLVGEELSPDDIVRRQGAVSRVSSVVKAGTRIFEERGVQLTEDGRRFVVEIPTVERDRAGRIAPIICCGEYDSTVGDALGASVAAGLGDFARRIGRTINPEHFELVLQSFAALKKKSSTRRLVRVVEIVALALVVLLLVYWLGKSPPQPPLPHPPAPNTGLQGR